MSAGGLPWGERVNMLSVNPHAADPHDIARLASEHARMRLLLHYRVRYDKDKAFAAEQGRIIREHTAGRVTRTFVEAWEDSVRTITDEAGRP